MRVLSAHSRVSRSGLIALAVLLLLSLAGSLGAQTIRFAGQTAVGIDSAPQTVTLTFAKSGTLSTVQVLSAGSAHFDFNQTTGGSCTIGLSYQAGQQCTVNVGFHPFAPGERRGAVVLLDSADQPLGGSLLEATATGSLAVFIPGLMSTIAGDESWIYAGDGAPATNSSIFLPFGLALNAAGDLFIADSSNNRIRRVDAKTGTMSTYAGTGVIGSTGDGGPATLATLSNPTSVALDAAGDLFLADSGNNVIRRVDAFTGVITTVAGTINQHGYTGDGQAAMAATLNTPNGIAFDAFGNLFLADTGNNAVREVLATDGTIQTVAGTGAAGFNGDGQPAIKAQLNAPWSVTPVAGGSLYIADQENDRVRLVNAAGQISTVAGNGISGFSGDAVVATMAELKEPASVVLDPAGNLYIADAGNNRVRKVNAMTGQITTVAGNQAESFSGDGGPADAASLYGPYTLAIDGQGALIIADVFHNRIRKVQANTALLSYPAQRVNRASLPLDQTLENDGNAALNLSSVTAVSNAQVDAPSTTCVAGTPLSPVQQCTLGAVFAPTMTGSPASGAISVTSDAANSPGTLELSGQVLDTDPSTTTLSASENPATTGDTVTFTVQVQSGGSTPTGTVSVLDGPNLIAAVPLTAGAGSFSTNTLTRGQHILSASYPGDASNASSSSPNLTEVVADALSSTATTLASNANPVPAGGALRLTANVVISSQGTTPGTLSGTVSFTEGSNTLGAATLTNGSASISLTTLTPGSHNLVATYSGNATSQPSSGNALIQVVTVATTRLSLATSANPGWSGAPLALTAAILSTGGVPTGRITFFDGAQSLGSAALNGQGIATLNVPGAQWTPGAHSLTASYAGDQNDSGSTSSALSEQINLATTTAAVTSSLNPAGYGAPISLTATIASAGGTPTGTVQFFDGPTSLGSATLNANATATISLTPPSIGTHQLTAVYSGDPLNGGSTSGALTEVIEATEIAATLSSTANPSVFAQPLTLTANVTGSGAAPTGSVTFMDVSGSAPVQLGTATLNAAGIASINVASLTIGTHQLTVSYAGDTYHKATTSMELTQHIVQATTTTLNPGSAQSTAGLPLTFAITVTGASAQPVTGIVTLSDGATTLVSLVLDANGNATYITATLAVGSHTLIAHYGGDPLNAPSSSAPSVRMLGLATTQTALNTSGSPSFSGTPLTLTASVTGNGGTPGGSILFLDGKQTIATVPVTAQQGASQAGATLTVSTLTPGIHALTAVYAGDAYDQTSTSPAVTEQIAERTSVTITSSANPALLMDNVSLTVTVSNGISTAVPTGSVTLTDNGSAAGSAVLDAAGHAVFTLTAPLLGTHNFIASYAGDTQNIPGTSAAYAQVITLRPTVATFTPSATTLSAGQQLILVSIVAPTNAQARGPQPPTGTVSFLFGSTVVGTAAVDAGGVATLTLTAQQGIASMTASYSGDALYAPSVSAGIGIAVGPPVEFLITSKPQTLSIASGQHGSLALSIVTNASFADTIALGCAGLPTSATCSFSNDAVSLSGGGAQTVTVTIDTGNPLGVGGQASLASPGSGLAACGLLALLFGTRPMHRRRYRRVALFTLITALSLGGMLGLSGCGSNLNQTKTSPGSYLIQITGTGQKTGSIQTLPIQLTVTQ